MAETLDLIQQLLLWKIKMDSSVFHFDMTQLFVCFATLALIEKQRPACILRENQGVPANGPSLGSSHIGLGIIVADNAACRAGNVLTSRSGELS